MRIYSLKVDFESISQDHSEELRHSLDLDETVLVDVEVVPGVLENVGAISVTVEVLLGLIGVVAKVSLDDLHGDVLSIILVEVTSEGTILGDLSSILGEETVHESIVSLEGVLWWNHSLITSIGLSTIHVGWDLAILWWLVTLEGNVAIESWFWDIAELNKRMVILGFLVVANALLNELVQEIKSALVTEPLSGLNGGSREKS